MIGNRVGRPGAAGLSPSIEISAISTNSKSKIFFTTLGATVAAGLKGPAERRVEEGVEGDGAVIGVCTEDESLVAACASKSRPEPDGVNRGRVAVTLVTVEVGPAE